MDSFDLVVVVHILLRKGVITEENVRSVRDIRSLTNNLIAKGVFTKKELKRGKREIEKLALGYVEYKEDPANLNMRMPDFLRKEGDKYIDGSALGKMTR